MNQSEKQWKVSQFKVFRAKNQHLIKRTITLSYQKSSSTPAGYIIFCAGSDEKLRQIK